MTEPDLQRWLDEHVRSLDTLAAGHDGADLDPLRASLAGARVLGVGEAVVGTRELVMLAHRLLEVMVAAGVRTVALGAPESACVVVDEAVAGRAELARALEGVADWRWNTVDVAAVVSWLAEHNAACADDERVRVVGVDPVSAAPSVKAVARNLRRSDPALVEATGESLARLLAHRPEHATLPAAVAADAARVAQRLDRDGVSETLRRHGRAIGRAGEVACTPDEQRPGVRDRLVAAAVTAAADAAGGRPGPAVAWWGHARDVRVRLDGGVPSVGALLREHFARDYYALGLLLGRGEFRALRRRRVLGVTRAPALHRLPAPPADSVEAALGGAGTRVVDLRGGADADGIPDAVGAATRMRVLADPTPIGWKRHLEPATLAEYDGLAHVERSRQAAVR